MNDFKMQNLVPKYTKIKIFRGSAPNPAGGAYSAPPDPLAGGEGAGCPLPKNPTPALSPSGFELRPFGPRRFVPPLFEPLLRLWLRTKVMGVFLQLWGVHGLGKTLSKWQLGGLDPPNPRVGIAGGWGG